MNTAAEEIAGDGRDVTAIPCDVTSPEQVEQLVRQTVEYFGRLDVLVNNAGKSSRRRVADTPEEEWRELMEINFHSAVRITKAALPHLLKSRGHVVNIGSLASKVAPRFLGAYPASKFALAAFSQQLRLEHQEDGLHVLLVCPGPIAREEPRTYGAEEDADLPVSAARPGGGAKTKAIDPRELAGQIVRACGRRKRELVVPLKARLLFTLSQLSPRLGDWLLRKFTGGD